MCEVVTPSSSCLICSTVLCTFHVVSSTKTMSALISSAMGPMLVQLRRLPLLPDDPVAHRLRGREVVPRLGIVEVSALSPSQDELLLERHEGGERRPGEDLGGGEGGLHPS